MKRVYGATWNLLVAMYDARQSLFEIAKTAIFLGIFLAFSIAWRQVSNEASFNRQKLDALETHLVALEKKVMTSEALEIALKRSIDNQENVRVVLHKSNEEVKKALLDENVRMREEHKTIMKMVYESDRIQRSQNQEILDLLKKVAKKKEP